MLEWTGERYLPFIDPSVCGVEIHYEHLHRYAFASQFVRGRTVLDMASGEGYGSFLLAGEAARVVGVDIDPAAVEHASAVYRRDNLGFICGSITEVPLEGEHIFDVIVCYEAIEHIAEHDALIAEVRRLLKKDGIFIVSTPNKTLYTDILKNANPFHKKEMEYSEFLDLITRNFAHVRILGQSTLNGSRIFPIEKDNSCDSAEFLLRHDDGFAFRPESEEDNRNYSLYYIAVASNAAEDRTGGGRSYLVDPENTEITFLNARVSKYTSELHSLNQQIAGETRKILELTAERDFLNRDIKDLSSRIDILNRTVAAGEARISEVEAARTQLNKTLKEKEQRIADLVSGTKSLEKTVEDLESRAASQRQKILELTSARDALRNNLNARNQDLGRVKDALHSLKTENDALKSTISYRILNKFHTAVIERFFPPRTRRRDFYEISLKGGRLAVSEGFGKAFSEYRKYRFSKKRQADIPGAGIPPEVPLPPPPAAPPQPRPPVPATTAEGKPKENPVRWIFSQVNEKSAEFVPLSDTPVNLTPDDIRFIALYLPQFHPIPENDLWWGKGFTEWTNVTRALPQFIGHYQPHRPADLGYYDLRLPEVQKRQVELAKHYGVYGFCFHYYWFEGRRLLEKPLNQYLGHPEFDLPFCICWANENWTRRWDGMDNEILISQSHSAENDIRFIRDLEPVLRDPRYIRIHGKPLVIVYRATLLPEPAMTVQRWREYCRTCGIGEIYLVAALCFGCRNPTEFGFDAGMEFPPHTMAGCRNITREKTIINPDFAGQIYDYEDFVRTKKYLSPASFRLFRTVAPGWDNTARRPNHASIYTGADPEVYKDWLLDVSRLTQETHPKDEQIVFINAWNEWAEGTHLEPDMKFGYGYLQATSEVITAMRKSPAEKKKILVTSHDAHLHGAQMLALHLVKTLSRQFQYEVHLVLKSGGRLEEEFKKYSRVYNLEQEYPTPQSREDLAREFCRQQIPVAICNTVVCGDLVEVFSRHGIRTISLVHELPGVIRQLGLEENAKKIASGADTVVFPAAYVRDRFLQMQPVDESRCRIAPQGLFLKNRFRENRNEAGAILRRQLSLPEDSLIVLNIGYADFRKGPDLFVEVARRIIGKDRNVFFVWVGLKDESFMKNVEDLIDRAGIRDNIIFPGLCTENIDVYYSGADVFLLTSREDPFPSVVLDAMNAGMPVIGFEDAGGFHEIVTPDTGVLVPLPDAERMAADLDRLLKDPDLRHRLGRNGSRLIETAFSFPGYVITLLGFLGHQYRKVSVILPNYNYAHYLPGRLDTIISQDYPVYEIIALDDCSTDGSMEILQEFADRSPVPVRIVRNTTNSGSAFHQWARGIAMAAGDYIWICEADDLSRPGFLSEAIRGFEDDGVVLSYVQSLQMDENNAILADNYLAYTDDIDRDKWKSSYIRAGVDEIRDTLVIKNTIPNVSGTVFRKTDISPVVGDMVKLKIAGDWFFYVWLLQMGKISYTPAVLNLHRRHSNSITRAGNPRLHLDEIIHVQEYIMNRFGVDDAVRQKVMRYRDEVQRYLLG